jgi:hypothetical protein
MSKNTIPMNILPEEVMSYKQQKKENELLTKLKIVKLSKVDKFKNIEIASSYKCHRNTISTIISQFEAEIPPPDKNKLLKGNNTLDKMEELMKPLKSKSTKPKSPHPKQASQEQEEKIVELFRTNLKVGPKRMRRYLRRAFSTKGNKHRKVSSLENSLSELTLAQIKGVYKRQELKLKTKRSYNGNVVHLYDYVELSAFEYIHMDTKKITDQKALPKNIYDKFVDNPVLPIYEWNIIDAKSRFRFMAYSRNLNSEFGLKFLLSTIQFIRGTINNYDQIIHVLTDNGLEFMLGSEKKERDWNERLKVLNADIESYNVGHDVRKNLIERSHLTDDRDFYIPRGQFIYDKESFLEEAYGYFYYFNCLRPHSGIGMEDRTPLEVLKDSNVMNADKLLDYPAMILEDSISNLSDITSVVEISVQLRLYEEEKRKLADQKVLRNILASVPNFKFHAQNVLTPYLKPFGKI